MSNDPNFPYLPDDDLFLVFALQRAGFSVRQLLWEEEPVLQGIDACLVRAPFDYTEKKEHFIARMEALAASGVPLINPAAILRWNSDKIYLEELRERGIRVIPTVYTDALPDLTLREIMVRFGWEKAVVKPSVSAGGEATYLVDLGDVEFAEAGFAREKRGRRLMVQPFLPEIVAQGEWSLIFFAGSFSHALKKRPKQGEFRVQDLYGGTVHQEDVPLSLIDQARTVLEATPRDWFYARVDGCLVEGVFTLIELELIEPELFFRIAPQSADAFASALVERLS